MTSRAHPLSAKRPPIWDNNRFVESCNNYWPVFSLILLSSSVIIASVSSRLTSRIFVRKNTLLRYHSAAAWIFPILSNNPFVIFVSNKFNDEGLRFVSKVI